MDRLHAIPVYVRVAQLGSFSKAADDLEISRAAVSETVVALEKHLGVTLLARTTRRVTPTSEGVEYLQRCLRILGELEAADEAARGARTKPQGHLRVDVPTAYGRILLLPALPQFVKRYPDLELEVRFNDRVVDLVAERVDIAVRVGTVRPPNYVVRRIATTRRVVVGSPGYFAAEGWPQKPEQRTRHRLVGLLNGATGRTIEWEFRGRKVPKLRYSPVFNLAEAQLSAAIVGTGLAQTIDLMAGEQIARGKLETVLDEYVGDGPPISLVYLESAHRSAKIRVFSEFAAGLLLRWRENLAKGGRGSRED